MIELFTHALYLKILRHTVKAPSSHNSQPWLFFREVDGILIKPDLSKSLPATDPDNRELYISLGCAVETTIIAAGFYGYESVIKINNTDSEPSVKILMQKSERAFSSDLFPYINARQTTRNLYTQQKIAEPDIATINELKCEDGVQIQVFTTNNDIERFAPLITTANAIQMSSPQYSKELIQWMRFSRKEAMQKGDGLFTSCIGVPSTGRLLGSFVLKNFYPAESENKRLIKQLKHSSAIALFYSEEDDVEHWIKTGMTFQRFALTIQKMGLNHSYLNTPCQIESTRRSLMSELNLKEKKPQLLIRLGYSEKMPYSFRRNIEM